MTSMRELLSILGHELRVMLTRRIWMGGFAGHSARGALILVLAIVYVVVAGVWKGVMG